MQQQDVLDIEVVPMSPACGAEIKGVDLTKPLSRETVEAIRDAWNKHLVLVFRGQTISQDQQLTFASYFGDLGTRKKAPEPLRGRAEGTQQDHEKVLLVTNIKENGVPIGAFGEGEFWFHIDSGYSARPYQYTFLYALELPSTGGNTMFSNMYKAYEAVPEETQAQAYGQARAAHPRIQPLQASKRIRRHQQHPTPLPSGVRHRTPTPGARPCSSTADDHGARRFRQSRKATPSSISSTTSASGATSSMSTSGSSAIS